MLLRDVLQLCAGLAWRNSKFANSYCNEIQNPHGHTPPHPAVNFTSQSAIIEFGRRLSKKVNMAAIFTDVHRFAEEKLRCKNDNGREKAT